MTLSGKGPWFLVALLLVVATGSYYAWNHLRGDGLPDGIANGNGRIEAVEIDISTKTAGRISEIYAQEGDFVEAGQELARMDTRQLEARQREAEAQLRRATISIDTANSLVSQRQAEQEAAQAVVAQRQAELEAAQKRLERAERLSQSNAVSQQVLDDARATAQAAKATVSAAEAQVAASRAAITASRAQVVDAEAAVEAAQATIDSIETEIDDSILTSPRNGRVQYRIAQPGEVLSAGGRVLNLVNLEDVHMSFFLPTAQAGRVAIGADVRLVLDAAPQYIIPAEVSFVADTAQFTPRTVETREERQKLMFRVKARIPPELLRKHIEQVKTGLPGMAYVRLDPEANWPDSLQGTLVE